MEVCYCPICGKRIEQPKSTKTCTMNGSVYTVNFYVTNHTEPICPGHSTALANMPECGSWEIETPGYGESVDVPQAFYDAFKDEE